MGRSAKLHKRTQKNASGTSLIATAKTQVKPPAAAVANAKRKAGLRTKASGTKSGDGPVLGSADYVALMMGGRRKAREEARKLPRDDREAPEGGREMEM